MASSSGENTNISVSGGGGNQKRHKSSPRMRLNPRAIMKKQSAIFESSNDLDLSETLTTILTPPKLEGKPTVNIEPTSTPTRTRKPMSVIVTNQSQLLVGYNAAAGGGSVSSLNNLTVSGRHLAPRKSVIGRLERPSFQAQRLSDVGVAFGQQITAKMGLKLPASQERIVEQTRWLYLRYIFVKLRQNTLPLRDLNLTKTSRARRAAALGEIPIILSSAPATAGVDLTATSSGRLGIRKRTAMSGSIDPQELSLLAARIQAINLKSDKLRNNNSNNNNNNDKTSRETIAGGANTTSRKYIMDPTINNQIFAVILKVIRELRDLRPEFYGDTIYELIGIDKFSSIQSLLDVQMTICQEMTRSEISWCRIIALFSLFGAISLDCVRLGTPEHVGPILDGFIEFVERDLALWISQQGGWESFLYKHRQGYRFWHLTTRVITVALPLIVWIILVVIYWNM